MTPGRPADGTGPGPGPGRTAHASRRRAPAPGVRALSLGRGLWEAFAVPHRSARILAVGDSRAIVRSLFLSSGARSGWLARIASGVSLQRLARDAGVTRDDRLEAWLEVGCALRELRRVDDRYRLRGRRSKAIGAGDPLLCAHYSSVLDYQGGPYADLRDLLEQPSGSGRDDLQDYAEEIAQVSLAAVPFVAPLVRRTVADLRPANVLDAGCGSAVYSRLILQRDRSVRVTGVDVSSEVIRRAGAGLEAAGLGARARLVCAELEGWSNGTTEQFELVMLHNNIYYFPPDRRSALFALLATHLSPGGELLITTMTRPGSVAAAHLHLMLVSQAGTAALPERGAIEHDLVQAGLAIRSVRSPVPGEPYLVVRAVRR